MLEETNELNGVRAVVTLDEADVVETAEVSCKLCGEVAPMTTMWYDFNDSVFICAECAEAMDDESTCTPDYVSELDTCTLGDADFDVDADF